MDPALQSIASSTLTWQNVCAIAIVSLLAGWKYWLDHRQVSGQLARYPDAPTPPAKPAAPILPLLVLLLVLGIGLVAAAVSGSRLASRPTNCGPCFPPAACTPQGCRGVGTPAPAPPPEPAQQSRNEPRRVSDLDSPYWPAAFPWHPGDREVN